MTERLYENDSHLYRFTAVVVSCRKNENELFEIILNRSAFFPEGGGQAADTGHIDNATVIDVRLINQEIIHFANTPVEKGKTVDCAIDWGNRFKRMQNHSGEHLISGIIHTNYGFDNIGFHMNDELVTVDINGKINNQEVEKIEILANEAIYENVLVRAFYPPKDQLDGYHYRSKKELSEAVRLVEIEGYDLCACCAPHVNRTGEIGIIKILNAEPCHGGGTRLELVCGQNAYEDYCFLHNENKRIMQTLSSQRKETSDSVAQHKLREERLFAENKDLRNQLALLRLERIDFGNALLSFAEGSSFDEMTYCLNEIGKQKQYRLCAVFSKSNDCYLYCVSYENINDSSIVRLINTKLSGRGGGRDGYAQGKVSASKEHILEVLKEIAINLAGKGE